MRNFIVLAAIASLPLMASTDHEEKLKQSWSTAIQNTREYSVAKRDQLAQESRKVIDEAREELNRLQNKTKTQLGTAREKLDREIHRLEGQIKEAESTLEQLQASSGTKWEIARQRVGKALDSIVLGFSNAWSDLKN